MVVRVVRQLLVSGGRKALEGGVNTHKRVYEYRQGATTCGALVARQERGWRDCQEAEQELLADEARRTLQAA